MEIRNSEHLEYDIEMTKCYDEEYDSYYTERVNDKQSFEHWQKAMPPILFKYRSLNTAKCLVRVIDILKENRLFISEAKDLNDPFEGGNVDFLSVEDMCEYEERIKKCRVLSLSKDCFSSPLWAHYADEGAGVCIGFFTFETFQCADELTYTDTIDRKQWWSVDKDDALRKEFSFKNQDWEYESEYRIIRTDAEDAFSYLDFKPNEMALIIFGEKIDEEVKRILKDFVPDNVFCFDIKADRKRARYYLTECNSNKIVAYTLDGLYKIIKDK